MRRPLKNAKRTKKDLTVARNISTVSSIVYNFIITFLHYFFSFLGIQEKLGILNGGEVSAVFSYDAQQMDELNFDVNDRLTILRKGDDAEREWWWARMESGQEGYVPRNLLGVSLIIFLAVLKSILLNFRIFFAAISSSTVTTTI